jgi:hypothetical protein
MAVLLFLAVAVAAAGDGFLVHTDDGCVTETHCLTCRSVLARTADVSLVPAITPFVVLAPAVAAPDLTTFEPATPRHVAPRGPPAA